MDKMESINVTIKLLLVAMKLKEATTIHFRKDQLA